MLHQNRPLRRLRWFWTTASDKVRCEKKKKKKNYVCGGGLGRSLALREGVRIYKCSEWVEVCGWKCVSSTES